MTTPSEGVVAGGDERRLHPWSWLFVLIQQLKSFALPLVVVIMGAIFLVLGLGIVALGEWLGSWLGAWMKRPFTPGWATFWGTLLLLLVFQLPWLGNGLFLGTSVLLFGAMLLSRFGTRAYEPPSHLATSEDLSSYSRPSQAQRERPYQ